MARKKGAVRPPDFESIVTDPSQSFKWHQHDCPSNIARWNYHPEYEIHLITRTHGRQFVGDYIGEFSPGNLVLTGSNLPHNWMSDLKPDEVIEGRDIVIQFAPDLLRSRADVFPELADLEPFLTDALRGFEFFGDSARRGADLMRCIGAARGFQRLALFFELVDLLARAPEKKILASPDYAPTLDKETLRVVHDVISYIVGQSLGDDQNVGGGRDRRDEAIGLFSLLQEEHGRQFCRLFTKTARRPRPASYCRTPDARSPTSASRSATQISPTSTAISAGNAA